MAGAGVRRRKRSRGSVQELPSGSLRVSVYAGIDPVSHRRHYLREVVPPGPGSAANPVCGPTAAIRCAESGDQGRRRCATHRGWSGGRTACVGADEEDLTLTRELGSSVNISAPKGR